MLGRWAVLSLSQGFQANKGPLRPLQPLPPTPPPPFTFPQVGVRGGAAQLFLPQSQKEQARPFRDPFCHVGTEPGGGWPGRGWGRLLFMAFQPLQFFLSVFVAGAQGMKTGRTQNVCIFM